MLSGPGQFAENETNEVLILNKEFHNFKANYDIFVSINFLKQFSSIFKLFKGTVVVMSSDLTFKEGHA